MLRTLLGDVLRRRRLAQRRTLADVAGKASISMPYLSEVERGRKEASSEVLAAVCDALKVQLSEVLAEVGRDLAREAATRHQTLDRALGAQLVRIESARRRSAVASPTRRSVVASPARRSAVAPPARGSGDVVLRAA